MRNRKVTTDDLKHGCRMSYGKNFDDVVAAVSAHIALLHFSGIEKSVALEHGFKMSQDIVSNVFEKSLNPLEHSELSLFLYSEAADHFEEREAPEEDEEFDQNQALEQFKELCHKRFAEFKQLPNYQARVKQTNFSFISSVDLEIGELERKAHEHGYQLEDNWEQTKAGINQRCLIRPLTAEEKVYWEEIFEGNKE